MNGSGPARALIVCGVALSSLACSGGSGVLPWPSDGNGPDGAVPADGTATGRDAGAPVQDAGAGPSAADPTADGAGLPGALDSSVASGSSNDETAHASSEASSSDATAHGPTAGDDEAGPPPGAGCSVKFGQCGGESWAGPRCCVASACVAQNPYFSQCL